MGRGWEQAHAIPASRIDRGAAGNGPRDGLAAPQRKARLLHLDRQQPQDLLNHLGKERLQVLLPLLISCRDLQSS